MKKVDLLSLFFFDPLHQSFDALYTTTPIQLADITKPTEILEPSPSPSSSSSSSSQSNEISSEDRTDPADLSSEGSLHDEVDTSSNMTSIEPAWCGCVEPCNCEDEYHYRQDEIDRECESRWEAKAITVRELHLLQFADAWEGRQRTKGQRNGKQLRAKRSEKKDKVWPARYVRSLASKKQGEKNSLLSEHFECQKGNGNKNRTSYVNFGSRHSHTHHNHRDESAEVQRAITLSLSTTPSNTSNALSCGLTQRQLNDLMNRELTPEDYELLLRLDEGVAKKTVKSDALDRFASRAATASDVEESACTISFNGKIGIGKKKKRKRNKSCTTPLL
eukprot:Phypoly_transcript_07779.p1 GENE.Phypoly_transcript_07779~~Phypoly_transcript_07779.p1  ORF type:complete len:369 (+),score=78.13 Phypoly_transcript_07779:110-1108(+)